MKRLWLAALILLGACTVHLSDATRDAQTNDLLTRVQRLETLKADAKLVGDAIQGQEREITELKTRLDAKK